MEDPQTFALEGLDHVALTVTDVTRSVEWYRTVLGLERRCEETWGDYPAVVGVGTTALALFPVASEAPKPPPGRDTLAMRHLAFRVNRVNFERARRSLTARGIPLESQHHGIADSIYFHDPDGHEIEITTYDFAPAG